MRGIEDTRQRWNTLFHRRDTPSDLRSALKSEQDNICDDGLRSICWKAFLLFENLSRTQWPSEISEARSAYIALREYFLKYIEHPDDLQSSIDPLADDEQSPWQTLREDEQMRAEISQDVDRCLQENYFFREPATKAKMIDILFIYSKLNPDLGYRQGMHELLAPILWVIDRDALDPKLREGSSSTGQNDDLMFQLLDSDYIEHDAFTLFCSVMQTTRVYYEHNRHRAINGQADTIPIVLQCEHIHNELLVATDLELADHLQALDILPQIFLTRWMRLLFGREFPFQDMLVIWDFLFAEKLRVELIDFVCVAMLLRVRWQLLSSDSSAVLTTLLRYPSPQPHAPASFVEDGLYLEQNPTSERGAFIISKYSGNPPDSSKMSDPLSGKARPGRKFQVRSDFKENSETTSPSRSPARNNPLNIEALFQDVSEGIQRRTETWGVAKAVRGAVNEAKKNMQAIQSEQTARFLKYGDPSTIRALGPSLYQESESIAELKAKIEALEERNRILAKTLGQAVTDIHSQIDNNKTLDADTTTSLKQALAKAKSVQNSLDSSSAPNEPNLPKVGDTMKEAAPADNSMAAKEKKAASENDTPLRSPTNTSASNIPTAKSPAPIDSGPRTALSPKPANNARPLRHATRPSLANSEFSWMLGQDRHLSSFVSPASVPPEQTRHGDSRNKQNALFGNGDVEQRNPSAEPDGMVLKSLRGGKTEEE